MRRVLRFGIGKPLSGNDSNPGQSPMLRNVRLCRHSGRIFRYGSQSIDKYSSMVLCIILSEIDFNSMPSEISSCLRVEGSFPLGKDFRDEHCSIFKTSRRQVLLALMEL